MDPPASGSGSFFSALGKRGFRAPAATTSILPASFSALVYCRSTSALTTPHPELAIHGSSVTLFFLSPAAIRSALDSERAYSVSVEYSTELLEVTSGFLLDSGSSCPKRS